MNFEWLIPIVAIISVFGSTSLIVWLVVDFFRQRNTLKVATEFHGKLLDRLSSARDFSEFFNSEGGTRFLNSLSTGGAKAPHTRIIRAVQSGIVMVALGVALFLFTWLNPDMWEDAHRVVTFLATIAFALGVGLIIAAAVSYALSRRLGLLDDDAARRTMTPSA